MAKIYWLYRMIKTKTKEWATDRHSPSYFLNAELEDYIDVWVFSLHDMDIPDSKYTKELAPWIKNQAKFFWAEYNENAVPQSYVDMILDKRLSVFYIEQFATANDAATWLRDNTNCQEVEPNKFEARAEFVDESWETIPAVYITID